MMTERTDNQELLRDGVWRLLLRYSLPSVASMVGISLYILADTYFIANGIGETALAALNIALPCYSFIGCIGNMIGIGGATTFAIARENGDGRTRRGVFTLCIAFVLLCGIAFFLCGLFAARRISLLLGASSDTLPYAEVYIRVLLLFAPFFLVNNVITAFVRNDRGPNLAMVSMLSGVLFNIVFDYVFIYITGWGMFGAILATCLAPIVGLGVLSAHFLRRRNTFALVRAKPVPGGFHKILHGGSATFITEIAAGLVILAFNFKLLSLLGDVGVAAYGVISNTAYVMLSIFNGLGQGVQPLVSSNYGAGLGGRCREILGKGVLASFVISALLVTTVLVFNKPVVALFNRDANAMLAAIAERGIVIYFTSFLFCGVNIMAIAYYQAMLRSGVAVGISLSRGIIGVAAGLAILPGIFGADGVWLTAPFAEILASVLVLMLLMREKRIGTVHRSQESP